MTNKKPKDSNGTILNVGDEIYIIGHPSTSSKLVYVTSSMKRMFNDNKLRKIISFNNKGTYGFTAFVDGYHWNVKSLLKTDLVKNPKITNSKKDTFDISTLIT